MNTRRRGVSLLELLAVIAIVAVVAGMLLLGIYRFWRRPLDPVRGQTVHPAARVAIPRRRLGPGDNRRLPLVDTSGFVQTGGVVNGDKYHNILFQNPGQGNHWLTVKLIGKKTNRSAIGARIKVVTAGEKPLEIHRHVSSGSSFGANPLEQTIGLASSARVARLEIHWPTSGTTQVLLDIAADQAIEVTEFALAVRPLNVKPIRAQAP